jgi:hypothetical protein
LCPHALNIQRVSSPTTSTAPVAISHTISSLFERSTSTSKEEKASNDRNLVELLASADLPISLVEHAHFIKFCRGLNPSYKVPGRTKAMEHIKERYEDVKSSLLKTLAGVESVSITTDAATTISQHSLQAITAHFISDQWVLHSALLENVAMPERHTAENLVTLLQHAFTRWQIDDKVYTSTTDAAANILKCCKTLEETDVIEESVRCFCHTCQLSVKTALDETESIQAILTAARAIVRFAKTSNIAAEALRRLQSDEKEAEDLAEEAAPVDQSHPKYENRPLKLLQDVVTRWSSTHTMCARLVKLKRFVTQLLDELKPELALSPRQWQQLHELCQVLQPCADAIKFLEGEKYPTLSSVIPTVLMLRALLDGKTAAQPNMPDYSGFTAEVNQVRRRILAEMAVPGRFDSFSRAARFACLLDPRYKALSFIAPPDRETMWESLLQYCATHFPPPPPPPAPPLPHSLTVQPSAADAPSLYTPLSFVSLLHHSLQTSAIEDQSLTAEFFAYRRTPGCDSSENPLTWWRRNEKTFPTLARAAKRFLAIPASSAPSERAFSKINIVIDKRRASLLPENADKLCFLKHNCTLNL